jgi:hypothetical protein
MKKIIIFSVIPILSIIIVFSIFTFYRLNKPSNTSHNNINTTDVWTNQSDERSDENNPPAITPYRETEAVWSGEMLNSIFRYNKIEDGRDYVKVNEQTYGPFIKANNIWQAGANWSFSFTEDDKVWKTYVNGKKYEDALFNGSAVLTRKNWGFYAKKISTGKHYAIINDKEYGPYDDLELNEGFGMSENKWVFWAEKGGEYYIVSESDEVRTDLKPIAENSLKRKISTTVNDSFWASTFTYYDLKNFSSFKGNNIVINYESFGPFQDGSFGYLANGKQWVLDYKQDDKYYLNVNKKIYGPYDLPVTAALGEDKLLVMQEESDGNIKLVLDGTDAGVYRFTQTSPLPSSGNSENPSDILWFIYQQEEKNYINIDGKAFGGYTMIHALEAVLGNWAFVYQDAPEAGSKADALGLITQNQKVNHNGESITARGIVESLRVDEANWGFVDLDLKAGKQYVRVNDGIYGPFGTEEKIELLLKDNSWIFAFNDNNQGYLVKNGKKYGPSAGKLRNIKYAGKNSWTAEYAPAADTYDSNYKYFYLLDEKGQLNSYRERVEL